MWWAWGGASTASGRQRLRIGNGWPGGWPAPSRMAGMEVPLNLCCDLPINSDKHWHGSVPNGAGAKLGRIRST